jgi:periplasmic protein TonB
MPIDVDIYGYKQGLTGSFCISIAMHLGLLAFVLFVPALLSHEGLSWGNNGNGGVSGEGAISANLVSGIPLPPQAHARPEQVLANDSKGLSQPLPAPAPKKVVEDKEAIAIPDRQAKIKPPKPELIKPRQQAEVIPPARPAPIAPPVTTPTQLPPVQQPPRPADNVVPFGKGGPMSGPFTTMNASNGAGGLKFGEGGSGTFGSLYGWYADVVARKVHDAWQSEVNPNVASANRVYLTFNIARDGKPSDIKLEHSSGVPSLDVSAQRAVERIDTFGPLPAGYRGSYVSVEFWFDYRR